MAVDLNVSRVIHILSIGIGIGYGEEWNSQKSFHNQLSTKILFPMYIGQYRVSILYYMLHLMMQHNDNLYQ